MISEAGATLADNKTSEEFRWQCQKCGDSVEGDPGKYLNFCRLHTKAKGCEVRLVNKAGDIVANSKEDAKRRGIFKGKGDLEVGSSEEKEKIPKPGQPLLQGFFKTQTVELDPRVQMYHHVFMQEHLIPLDTTLGQFILGTIETLLEMTGRKLAIVQMKGGD